MAQNVLVDMKKIAEKHFNTDFFISVELHPGKNVPDPWHEKEY
jgi:hypothetical protein